MRQPVQQLIQLYQNNLFTAAFNICQNQMDAEDAVQETFVQYYTSRKEFENEQHIRAWLLRVVINKAKNINRTFWKKNKCSLEDYMETLSFPDSQSRDLFEEVMKLPDIVQGEHHALPSDGRPGLAYRNQEIYGKGYPCTHRSGECHRV